MCKVDTTTMDMTTSLKQFGERDHANYGSGGSHSSSSQADLLRPVLKNQWSSKLLSPGDWWHHTEEDHEQPPQQQDCQRQDTLKDEETSSLSWLSPSSKPTIKAPRPGLTKQWSSKRLLTDWWGTSSSDDSNQEKEQDDSQQPSNPKEEEEEEVEGNPFSSEESSSPSASKPELLGLANQGSSLGDLIGSLWNSNSFLDTSARSRNSNSFLDTSARSSRNSHSFLDISARSITIEAVAVVPEEQEPEEEEEEQQHVVHDELDGREESSSAEPLDEVPLSPVQQVNQEESKCQDEEPVGDDEGSSLDESIRIPTLKAFGERPISSDDPDQQYCLRQGKFLSNAIEEQKRHNSFRYLVATFNESFRLNDE